MSAEVLSLSVSVDRSVVPRGRPTHVFAAIEVKANAAAEVVVRPPLSVVFAIDVSLSMAGRPLDQVIQSANRLLDLLRPGDNAGFVSFANTGAIVSRMEAVTPASKERMKAQLGTLRAQYGTNISAGLMAASRLLNGPGKKLVLLLSDGEPNVGITDAPELANMARSIRGAASVSVLGYGESHDERVLGAIAEGGGGTYHFVREPSLCAFELARALGAQNDAVAEQVELEVLVDAPNRLVKRLGGDITNLSPGETRLLAAEIEVNPIYEEGPLPIGRAVLRYRKTGESEMRELVQKISVSAGPMLSPPDLRALHCVLIVRADHERACARVEADAGNFSAAGMRMRKLLIEIETAPGYQTTSGDPLFEAREQVLDDATLFEQRPDASQYASFRRGQRAVLAATPAHSSHHARAAMAAVAGDAHVARFEIDGREVVELHGEGIIGRSSACSIYIPSAKLSRQHAHVFPLDGDHFISDLGSSNGVYVNGAKIDVHKLAHGDRVNIGDVVMKFVSPRIG
jgi:Ca-activated chloride channel family protein